MAYTYFGALIRKFDDPTKILKKAKAEADKRGKVSRTIDTITSPLQTVLKKIIYRGTTTSTVTDEAKVRALINKVLIEHNLI